MQYATKKVEFRGQSGASAGIVRALKGGDRRCAPCCVSKIGFCMSQEKSAEIIDLSVSRAAAAGDYAGAFLASERHAAGLDITDVAAATKIRPEHLEAIEAGDAARLPSTPFAVGFVKVYARYLDLDAEEIAAQFKRELLIARPVAEPSPAASTIPATDASAGVKLASLIGIILIAAFAIWIAFQVAGNSERDATNGAADTPQVRVSEVRAEVPRPRVTNTDLPVEAIPPVARAEETLEVDAEASGGQEPENIAGQVFAQEAPVASPVDENPTPPAAQPTITPPLPEPDPVLVQSQAEPQVENTQPENPAIPPAVFEEPSSVVEPPALDEPLQAPIAQPVRTPPQSQPVPVSEPESVIVEARLIRSIGPDYPNRCERRAEPLETVSVIFDVTAAGRPANTRVTGASNSCFEGAAVRAISKWRFNPRTVDGAPRPQSGVEATLNFRR